MIVRNGQALGSVLHSAEPGAGRPKSEPQRRPDLKRKAEHAELPGPAPSAEAPAETGSAKPGAAADAKQEAVAKTP